LDSTQYLNRQAGASMDVSVYMTYSFSSYNTIQPDTLTQNNFSLSCSVSDWL